MLKTSFSVKGNTGLHFRPHALVTAVVFVVGSVVSFASRADDCAPIFEADRVSFKSDATIGLDSLWKQIASFESEAQFIEAYLKSPNVAAQVANHSVSERTVYRDVFLPALWRYARLASESRPSSNPIAALVNRAQRSVPVNGVRTPQVRPPVMTPEERRFAIESGSYENASAVRPDERTPLQRFIQSRIGDKKLWPASAASTREANDPVRIAFNKSLLLGGVITSDDLSVAASGPMTFAIVLVQKAGGLYRDSKENEQLVESIPWSRVNRSSTAAFEVIADIAIASDRTRSKQVATEALRNEFVPKAK